MERVFPLREGQTARPTIYFTGEGGGTMMEQAGGSNFSQARSPAAERPRGLPPRSPSMPILHTQATEGGQQPMPSLGAGLIGQREPESPASCPFPPLCPQGDSGGPLVCNNVVQGIVSYGDSNGIPPAVFTKIQSFLPWIKRTMRRLAPRTSATY